MKHIMVTTALGLFGLLLLGPGALAQTTSFNVVNPGHPADGDWHVVVTQTGLTFTVSVKADTGVNIPASNANEVQVTLLDTANNAMSAVNNGGGTSGNGGGTWKNIANGKTIDWKWDQSLLPHLTLQRDGSSSFLGTLNLVPLPGEKSQWVDVTVFDSIHGPWTETEQLAPEASSLALLLPGLIPIGIVLRGRRKTRA